MKRTLGLLLFVAFFVLLGKVTRAQEVRYSQYYIVMPAINPAATGAFGGDYRLMANYRMNHYSGAGDAFTTIYGSYDQGIKKYKKDGNAKNTFFSAGLSFMNDKAGIGSLTSTEISGLLSFHLKIADRNFLSIGTRLGYATRSVDYTNFKWASQFNRGDGSYDPTLPTDPLVKFDNVNYFPLGAGLMWNYSNPEKLKLNAGVSLNRLNEPDVAFDANVTEKLPMQIVGNVGADWFIPNSIVSLMPTVLYISQDYYSEVNMGMFFKWYLSFDSKMTHIKKTSILYTGIFYRTTGDMILSMKLDLRRNLTLGVAYDTGIDGDAYRGRSALEIAIIYRGFFMEKSLLPNKADSEFFY